MEENITLPGIPLSSGTFIGRRFILDCCLFGVCSPLLRVNLNLEFLFSTSDNVLLLINFIKHPVQTLWFSLINLFRCKMVSLERSAAKTFGLVPAVHFIFLSNTVSRHTAVPHGSLNLVRSLIARYSTTTPARCCFLQ